MFDPSDMAFASALERAIIKTLSGDNNTPGLYQALRNSQSWESFKYTSGVIQGYEAVLSEMRAISQRMNTNGGDVQHASYQSRN